MIVSHTARVNMGQDHQRFPQQMGLYKSMGL